MSARRYLFTLNNYTSDDLESIRAFAEQCTYVCYGLEEAPTTGTPHVQGYFSLKTPWRLHGIGRKFGGTFPWLTRARLELANGDRTANRNYCFKIREQDPEPNSDVWESEEPKPGKRTDIERTCETIRDAGLQAAATLHPGSFVKYHSGFQAYANHVRTARDPATPPQVWWWYGPTGTGKTRSAFNFAAATGQPIWKSSRSLKWWPGYDQQAIALIDDFRKDFITFHGLLTVLDRYPETVEVKGGHVHLNSKTFIVTSCHPPWSTYETREDVGQLLRRIGQVVRYDSDGTKRIVDHSPGVLHPVFNGNYREYPAGRLREHGYERLAIGGKQLGPGKRPRTGSGQLQSSGSSGSDQSGAAADETLCDDTDYLETLFLPNP